MGEQVKHSVGFEAAVVVTINNSDVVDRVTDPVRGEEWRKQAYQLFTASEVVTHLAYNCLANGVHRANQLDGWADLDDDAAVMSVEGFEPTGGVPIERAPDDQP